MLVLLNIAGRKFKHVPYKLLFGPVDAGERHHPKQGEPQEVCGLPATADWCQRVKEVPSEVERQPGNTT
jgi:hypothetical protein